MAVAVPAVNANAAEIISSTAGGTREPGVYFMDALVTLDVPPAALRTVIYKMCDYKKDMPHVAYCKVFKTQGKTAYSYMVIDVPVIEPRDYTVASTTDEDLNADGSGTFRSHWTLANDLGPQQRDGVTRLSVNQGSWTMRGIDGGRRTEMHYSVRVSPGGNIPSWAAGYVSKKTLPDYMRTLERLAQEEERRNAVMKPAPENTLSGMTVTPLEQPLPPIQRKSSNRLTALLP